LELNNFLWFWYFLSIDSNMSSEYLPYDYLFKLLLVGDSGVGKTSLLLRFATSEFREAVNSTVGVDLKVKLVNFRGKRLKLTIWDTAGQERFRTLTSAYYRGAHGIILVYDISKRDSFEHVKDWLKEIEIYSTNEDAVIMLVANKIDKDSERQVSKEEGKAFARSRNMLFIEASAKTEQGVQDAFDELVQKILDVPSLCHEETKKDTGNVDVSAEKADDVGGGLCSGCYGT